MAVVSNGTTLIDNGILDAGVPTGSLILLSTQTASASATISFTTGLDSTYDEYVFKFINMHPATDNSNFSFNFSTDSGSNYNVTKTSTYFYTYHNEGDAGNGFAYDTGRDLAQSTSFQFLTDDAGSDADQSQSGSLIIFNPSSTTYVKHFIATMQYSAGSDHSFNSYIAGYGNTTSAVNAIQFKMDSGNIDDGIIKLYGVK
jgi:hypothetical protein